MEYHIEYYDADCGWCRVCKEEHGYIRQTWQEREAAIRWATLLCVDNVWAVRIWECGATARRLIYLREEMLPEGTREGMRDE